MTRPKDEMAEHQKLELSEGLGVDAAIRRLTALFAAQGIEDCAADARLLTLAALRIDRASAIRDPDRPIGESAQMIARSAERRLTGEPVSRILGHKEFWGLDFIVTPAVLDPRPDTETLVSAALKHIGGRRGEALRILDLGVGSGAILCALLTECPQASGLGLDLSEDACAVAAANLERLGVSSRGHIRAGDWRTFDWTAREIGSFDVVVSNPPYIRSGDIAGLERDVRNFDPRLALDGGIDGLDAYRDLISLAPKLLAPGGCAILELGLGQEEAIGAIARSAGLRIARLENDLAGTPRVAVLLPPIGS